MTKRIPFLRPNLARKELFLPYIAQIEESRLYSNYGPLNSKFEQRVISEWFKSKGHCTTVNNATIGLMLAISALKRTTGKCAVMPSFTFSATPLAAMWCGLTPYYVDVDPDTWCIAPDALQAAIEKLGNEIAVIMPYATFGTAMPLDTYTRLHQSGLPVVIDAAASFGTTEQGMQFGQQFPGAVVFSFHATKSFGIGEGGLVYSADEDVIKQIRMSGNFGFSQQRESITLGLNSKISEYTAAIALATLDIYPQKIALRQKVHDWYLDQFLALGMVDHGWRTQKYCGHIPYQFMPMTTPAHIGNQMVVAELDKRGIEARTYFAPACHQQQIHLAHPRGPLSHTEILSCQIVSLPLWEEMKKEHVEYIVNVLNEIAEGFPINE